MRAFGFGFRAYLLGALAALVASTTAYVGCAQNRRLEEALGTSTDRELALTADALAREVDEAMRFHTTAIESLAAVVELSATMEPAMIGGILASHRKRFGGLDIIWVGDARGTALISDPPFLEPGLPMAGRNYGDRDYVRELVSTGRTAVSRVQIGRLTKQPNIQIATPIHDSRGALAGLAAESLRLDRFQAMAHRAVSTIPDGVALVIDHEGNVIAHSHRRSATMEPLGVRALCEPSGSSPRTAPDVDGTQTRGVVRVLPDRGWSVCVTQPTRVVARQITAAARTTLWAVLFALLVASVAAYGLAALLASPVRRLAAFAGASTTSRGGGAPPTSSRWAPREVEVLRGSLIVLLDRLHAHAGELEGQVAARTRSLAVSLERQRETHEQLQQASKMAAVGQLAAGVAHELNNPLTIILGFAQGLDARIAAGDPLRMPVASIVREALRCKNLVQELLTFSRTRKQTAELVDLDALVRSTTVLLETRARTQSVRIALELSSTPRTVRANLTQLQQVLVNLGTNALDAMPHGGVLTIRTRDEPGGGARLEVADTGTGIPEATRARMFEPFFTTKPVGEGTGLGLSLVYEILQQHGATITVDSTPAVGTTMTVRLPPDQEPDAPAASQEAG